MLENQLKAAADFITLQSSKASNGLEAIERFSACNLKVNLEATYTENDESSPIHSSSNISPIRLIFMDCLMPIMDGWSATRKIKGLICEKKFHRAQAIGLTALTGSEEEKLICFDSGMDFLFPKPTQVEVIREFLNDYCQLNDIFE